MSKKSRILPAEPGYPRSRRAPFSKPMGAVVVLAFVVIVGFAYFDAGEEPIHPIEQQVALPASSGPTSSGEGG